MNEANTCRTYVLPKLKSAGWEDETITEQYVLTPGRIVASLDGLQAKVNALQDLQFPSSHYEDCRIASCAIRNAERSCLRWC